MWIISFKLKLDVGSLNSHLLCLCLCLMQSHFSLWIEWFSSSPPLLMNQWNCRQKASLWSKRCFPSLFLFFSVFVFFVTCSPSLFYVCLTIKKSLWGINCLCFWSIWAQKLSLRTTTYLLVFFFAGVINLKSSG